MLMEDCRTLEETFPFHFLCSFLFPQRHWLFCPASLISDSSCFEEAGGSLQFLYVGLFDTFGVFCALLGINADV